MGHTKTGSWLDWLTRVVADLWSRSPRFLNVGSEQSHDHESPPFTPASAASGADCKEPPKHQTILGEYLYSQALKCDLNLTKITLTVRKEGH